MAKKETAPKKETTEKKPRAPRKSTKKTEPILEEEIIREIPEAPADENTTEAAPAFIETVCKVATVLPQEGLKIRKGPGVDFDKYAGVKIPAGTEVVVLEEKDGFVRIGYDQWVMKSYLGGI